MKLQLKSKPWGCMLTSSAMAMDIPQNRLAELIGHDGSEIIDPTALDPGGRRGFHPQEIIEVALQLGWSVTRFQRAPVSAINCEVLFLGDRQDRLNDLVKSTRGVLTGYGMRTAHAAAYEKGKVFCPDTGAIFDFSFPACEARQFYPTEILIYERIR